VGLLVLALVLGSVAGGSPGPAMADDSVGRPADGVFTLRGHGFGHGRGMSQYGSYGAALLGGTAQQILDFYYPGTTPAGAPLSQVKVALTDDNVDVVVKYEPNLAITDVASGAGALLPPGAVQWRLSRAGDGRQQIHYITASGERVPWSINGAPTFAGPLKFFNIPVIQVVRPDDTRGYRGSVMAVSSGSGVRTVNELALDDYLRGVVPRESPSSWPAAALQAQAVAARSYAVHLAENKPGGQWWDLCDTTACQVYGGAKDEVASTNNAIAATAMQVRMYGGKTIFAEFSSSNGGYTVGGARPYFPTKPDPYDGYTQSAAHSWKTTLSAGTIEGRYPQVGRLQALTVLARDGNGEWGGRVAQIRVSGTAGSVTVTGDQFRSAFALRSSWFVLEGGGPAIPARYNSEPELRAVLGPPVGGEQYSGGVAWQEYQNGRLYWSASTGVHLLRGGLLAAYLAAGGPASFGAPASDEAYTAGGAYNLFPNDVIFIWSPDTGAHYVRSGIRARWAKLGSEWGRLGFPTSDEVYLAGGVYSSFTGGRIYWSPGAGAWEVVGDIGAEWVARGGPQSGSGFPAGPELPAGGGGAYQPFASGWTMFWSPATGAHVVRGGIQAKWRQLGAEWSVLGYPDGDEEAVAGGAGWGQRFGHGWILWSDASGAHTIVDGPAATKWQALGGPSSTANLPTSDQGTTGAGGGGTWQHFLGGYSMYWSQASGAHAMRGGIRAHWRSTGAEWGPLGYPTSDEVYASGAVRQEFQGGTLEWSAATGTVSQVA
jgi:SpoIID/LytB domain protein